MGPSAVSEHSNAQWVPPCNVRFHISQCIRALGRYKSTVFLLAHGSLVRVKGLRQRGEEIHMNSYGKKTVEAGAGF